MPYIGRNPDKGNFSDLNGAKLILDADADTSITADTDDQIDIQIAGADDFQFTANKFTVATGSEIVTSSAGTSNTRFGVNAGNSIASGGNYNVTIGDEAGTALTTGDSNSLVGYAAGTAITTGVQNIAIGYVALQSEDTGSRSIAIGYSALQNQNNDANNYNVAVDMKQVEQ
jgi:hypothetical protein